MKTGCRTLERLESIRHVEGTRFRRAKLELEWTASIESRYGDQMTLVSTSEADAQQDIVAALEDDPQLEHVDIELETRR